MKFWNDMPEKTPLSGDEKIMIGDTYDNLPKQTTVTKIKDFLSDLFAPKGNTSSTLEEVEDKAESAISEIDELKGTYSGTLDGLAVKGDTTKTLAEIEEYAISNAEDISALANSMLNGDVGDSSLSLAKFSQSAIDYIGSGGNIVNQADEVLLKKITVSGTEVITMADKAYSASTNTGLGLKILTLGNGRSSNMLTAADFSLSNTVYRILSDFDFNGATITVPSGCTLDFQGGSFKNGSLGTAYDVKVTGDYTRGLSSLTNANYIFPLFGNNEFLLDVTNLPGPLAKYNMVGDAVTDNADNLNNLFSDSWLSRYGRTRPIILLFPATNRSTTRLTFLFKKPISIISPTTPYLKVLLYANLKWDLSSYTFLTQEEIAAGASIPDFTAFKIQNASRVDIIGSASLQGTGNATSNLVEIDAGKSTINGTFWEGATINGTNYYSTGINNALYLVYCKEVHVSGLRVHNALNGIMTLSNTAHIDNCEVYDIYGDNGITVGGTYSSTYSLPNRNAVVSNCYCHGCVDLGISVQIRNALVVNCKCVGCGNNNVASGTFGTNMSFNAGGGFSTEILSVVLSTSERENANVTYLNCVAEDCYNYGFFADSGGVKYVGCTVKNITPTFMQGTPATFLYSAIQLRLGAAFLVGTTNYASGNIREPLLITDCMIDNVPFEFGTAVSAAIEGSAIFNNCRIKNIVGNSTYNGVFVRKALFNSCIFDLTYVLNPAYTYAECKDATFASKNNYSGVWSITTGAIITSATATYCKIDKQVSLSGTLTFATASSSVTMTLPYVPDYGGILVVGNLTFTLTGNSTTATVISSVTGVQQFQLNYKTA